MRKKVKKNKLSWKKLLLYCIQLIAIIVLIISLIEIYKWYRDNKKNEEILENISEAVKIENVKVDEETKEEISVDFKELKEKMLIL